MLVVDENLLQVSPAKPQKQPAASFDGFGRGFLGRAERSRPRASGASSSKSSAPQGSTAPDGLEREIEEKLARLEQLQQVIVSKSASGADPVDGSEGRPRPMPAADFAAGSATSPHVQDFARCVENGFPVVVDPVDPDDEFDEQGGPSLSELATQLFGDGASLAALDVVDGDAVTDSTKTPSPKASSRGGGAPSERSEPTEDGD